MNAHNKEDKIMRRTTIIVSALGVILLITSPCWTQGRATLVRETAEYLAQKFGLRTPKELTTLTGRLERLAAQYGDEALTAARKVGPNVFQYVDDAGEQAPQVVRLLARYGNEAAWIVQRRPALALTSRYGDDAARALIRHGDVALPVIQNHGASAARAFGAIKPQNGRRLRWMFDDGDLQRIGRTDELLEVVFRYGDRAMEFIWKHRDALAVSAALIAFLKDPEPFLNGIKDITQIR
jgi:hypothetical protein